MDASKIKVGDKISLPANYRGKALPVMEWTVHKENKTTFGVWASNGKGSSWNLYLSKKTGKIA